MLCLHCNAHYLLENPLSSILALHPRIRAVLQHRPCHRICTWLGMYGARTPKPINLWSDDPFVNKLKRTVDACVLKHSTVHSGNLEGLRFRDLGFFWQDAPAERIPQIRFGAHLPGFEWKEAISGKCSSPASIGGIPPFLWQGSA